MASRSHSPARTRPRPGPGCAAPPAGQLSPPALTAERGPRHRPRLIHAEPALRSCSLEHGDLVAAGPDARALGLPAPAAVACSLARAHLLVVEHRQHLTRLDAIAFAHGDLADAARSPGRHRRVIALDPPAHRDHAWRNGGRGEEETPGRQTRRGPTTTATATTTQPDAPDPILCGDSARWLCQTPAPGPGCASA